MKRTIRFAICVTGLLAIGALGHVSAQQDGTISDREMRLVDFEELVYPAPAQTAHQQGAVVVRVALDDQGKVLDTVAISGAKALIPDCLANARRWRFEPNAHKAAIIVYNFHLTRELSKLGCSHFSVRPPNFATITSCVLEVQ